MVSHEASFGLNPNKRHSKKAVPDVKRISDEAILISDFILTVDIRDAIRDQAAIFSACTFQSVRSFDYP
jgi:hypothetical protein